MRDSGSRRFQRCACLASFAPQEAARGVHLPFAADLPTPPPKHHHIQVPTRFQGVEQYCEIFRGLLLEEIFATLASTLNEGDGGADGESDGMRNPGGRGGGSTTATPMRVYSFSEPGAGGFSHVTLAVEEGGGGGRGRGGGAHGGHNGGGAGGLGGGRTSGCSHG